MMPDRPTTLAEQAVQDVASRTARPQPALLTAVYVAFGVFFACTVFASILGLNSDIPKVGQAMGITSVLAGLATYFPLRSLEKEFSQAVSERYRELLERAKEQKR